MERTTINVEKRGEVGKGAARALRRKDIIPAVVYRAGDSLPVQFSKKEISRFINATSGEQIMVNLHFEDGSSRFALMKDYQIDPATGELLHADFFEVSLTEEVKVTVHVALVGEPIGVRRDGGILQHLLREIEVECLPDRIPGRVEVDITGIEIGQSIHVGELKLADGIKVLTDPDEVIANVVAPAVEEVAPVEAAAPETTEPEIIKKGKKEEEGAEEEEKKKKEEKA
jgi:large subunit ribosomal protein L25